ncbi:NAD(P)/FAD-dependent oxidoreductase [Pseudomonas sp. M30-35]|uniref:NAD(P)/FAD-dependent oxidoreductase n=1 Tax=Pseudomonas sp. M30-35 TaxID=1981174 RepID=UPI001C44DE20|nr:NAD(P)/FAD-dependent oxidoreductase [Pseudomonas sp. M30-35]
MNSDAIVIGGSFAGLSAAIYIARARRTVCVIDSGAPRNRFAGASHGFFGQDGQPPQAMISAAKQQLANYPNARLINGYATAAEQMSERFTVQLASGEVLRATKLVLAFGVSDVLPEIPGLASCWGVSLLHCPYCHGYEFANKRLGVLYAGPGSYRHATLISEWGPTTLYLNGQRILTRMRWPSLPSEVLRSNLQELLRPLLNMGIFQHCNSKRVATAP